MALTTAQKTALKAAILADPVLSAFPQTSDGAYAIAAALNELASPAFVVWRTDVSCMEIWKMLLAIGSFDAAKINVRDGLETAFGKNSATMAGILPHLRRLATRIEKLFATGTGAAPATMTLEGSLSWQDVYEARML